MALPQNNNSITFPPRLQEITRLKPVENKGQKKGQLELAHLGTVLDVLKSDLELVKGADHKGGSNDSFEDAMAQMAYALQMLQVTLAKSSFMKTDMDREINQAQITLAEANLDQVQKTIQKMQKEQAKEKSEGFWSKFAEVLVTVVVDAVAVLTLNPEIAAFMIIVSSALLISSMTGASKGLTNLLAKPLELCGMSKKDAEMIAGAVITTATVVLTAIAAPEDEGSVIEEGAMNEVEDASEANLSKTEKILQTVKNGAKKVASPMKKAFKNTFGRLSTSTNFAIMTGTQMLIQTGLLANIAQAIATDNGNTDEKKAEILEVLMDAIASIMSLLSGGAAFTNLDAATTSEEEIEEVSKARKVFEQLKEMATSSKGLTAFLVTQTLLTAGASLAQVALGATQIKQGGLEEVLAGLNANLQLIRTAQDMSTSQTKEDQKHTASAEKSQKTGNQSISQLMVGEAAIAQDLTAYSPV